MHSLDFYFSLSLLPSFFSLFLPQLFSFAKHLVGFVLVGKAFRKAFRILELDERKGRWLVEQMEQKNPEVCNTCSVIQQILL